MKRKQQIGIGSIVLLFAVALAAMPIHGSIVNSPVAYYVVTAPGIGTQRNLNPISLTLSQYNISQNAIPGGVHLSMGESGATGEVSSGFYLVYGNLGSISNLAINLANYHMVGTARLALDLWFDTGNDSGFFQWDPSTGALTGINADKYGLGPNPNPTHSEIYVNDTVPFNVNSTLPFASTGAHYTMKQLKQNAVPGLSNATLTAIWIGIVWDPSGPASSGQVDVLLTGIVTAITSTSQTFTTTTSTATSLATSSSTVQRNTTTTSTSTAISTSTSLTGTITTITLTVPSVSTITSLSTVQSVITTTTSSTTSAPTIQFTPTSAQVGVVVQVYGSGFSSSDTSCSLLGAPLSSVACSISGGLLTASFTVANVATGYYPINAFGNPASDTGSGLFLVATAPVTTSTVTSLTTSNSISTIQTSTTTIVYSSITVTQPFQTSLTSTILTTSTTILSTVATSNTGSSPSLWTAAYWITLVGIVSAGLFLVLKYLMPKFTKKIPAVQSKPANTPPGSTAGAPPQFSLRPPNVDEMKQQLKTMFDTEKINKDQYNSYMRQLDPSYVPEQK